MRWLCLPAGLPRGPGQAGVYGAIPRRKRDATGARDPGPPCPHTQVTWRSLTQSTMLRTPAALGTRSHSVGWGNVTAELERAALSGSWPPDDWIGAIAHGQAGPVPAAERGSGQQGLEWANPSCDSTDMLHGLGHLP